MSSCWSRLLSFLAQVKTCSSAIISESFMFLHMNQGSNCTARHPHYRVISLAPTTIPRHTHYTVISLAPTTTPRNPHYTVISLAPTTIPTAYNALQHSSFHLTAKITPTVGSHTFAIRILHTLWDTLSCACAYTRRALIFLLFFLIGQNPCQEQTELINEYLLNDGYMSACSINV